jgi:hypothetical protein
MIQPFKEYSSPGVAMHTVVPAPPEAEEEDHLSLRVRGQPMQHSKTPSLLVWSQSCTALSSTPKETINP